MNLKQRFIFFLVLTILFNISCFRKVSPVPLTAYTPLFMNQAVLTNSVSLRDPTPIRNLGKIYQSGNYLFISERYEGVHVIDNSNPALPIAKAFVKAPGCVDIAVKNDALYLDNAVDLVCVDLTELKNGRLKITKRIENAFPELAPPDNGRIPQRFNKENRPENTVIVGWRK